MPDSTEFPHLDLVLRGEFEPFFSGGTAGTNKEIKENRADPSGHATRIRGRLEDMRRFDADLRQQREEGGLPPIPADKGFLLRLPENADVEYIVRALGVELVAETDEGLMLVSSEDLEFSRIEEVLNEFEAGTAGLVAGSSLLDIYDKPDDPRRLENILCTEALALWPFAEDKIYVFDLGIQTAASTREVNWPKVRPRKGETNADFQARQNEKRRSAYLEAEMEWHEKADARVKELREFVSHYGGEFLTGTMSDPEAEGENGIVFADSVQVRLKMNGAGFRDVILNFAHLFDVTPPPDLQAVPEAMPEEEKWIVPEFISPDETAPTVCVIDSGIQEEHQWLEPAIDSESSRCFLPDAAPDDVADYVQRQGHGTRVAGAVLYPHIIPQEGTVAPVAWIQNARVLNAGNELPERLPPERYLTQVVDHFRGGPRHTKVFNHSINANVPCARRRMSAWAAKMDELSHRQDVLFIQSAGNQTRRDQGNPPNPGLAAHLDAGRRPPEHQLEDSMRISNPGQSLHSLTVGSISAVAVADADSRSFADGEHRPSGFSRAGYGQPWSVVKPEVVEVGGDLAYASSPTIVRDHPELGIELLNSTIYGAPAYSSDGVGTSFSAPKVAHIAAHLQALYPDASPLLYRALIAQSARWPNWADAEPDKEKVLRWIGYGLPSIERATSNTGTRVTLITPDAEILPSKQLHLYSVQVPEEIRNAAHEARIRLDITLAYTALPRRTRARRSGYLETWLDWEASRLGEPADEFRHRMQNGGRSPYSNFRWTLHTRDDHGEAQGTSRGRGTLQKDWAVFDSYDLPKEFCVAVRAHKGWNHLNGAGQARYCLSVSFDATEASLPIYETIKTENRIEVETEARITT